MKSLAVAARREYRFGVAIFEPETTNALMAALLVHDRDGPLNAVWAVIAIGSATGLVLLLRQIGPDSPTGAYVP